MNKTKLIQEQQIREKIVLLRTKAQNLRYKELYDRIRKDDICSGILKNVSCVTKNEMIIKRYNEHVSNSNFLSSKEKQDLTIE